MTTFQSEQINELAEALAKAQAELEPAEKNDENVVGGGRTRKYANLTSVYLAIKSVLPKHGLAVAQTMLSNNENKAHVRTTLMHKSGQWIAGECILPCDRQNGIQGIGSAITYARRYSLAAIVGVVSEEDDDGAGAMPHKNGSNPQPQQRPPITKAQLDTLCAQYKKLGQDKARVMADVNAWLIERYGPTEDPPLEHLNQLFKDEAEALLSTLAARIQTQTPPAQQPAA